MAISTQYHVLSTQKFIDYLRTKRNTIWITVGNLSEDDYRVYLSCGGYKFRIPHNYVAVFDEMNFNYAKTVLKSTYQYKTIAYQYGKPLPFTDKFRGEIVGVLTSILRERKINRLLA